MSPGSAKAGSVGAIAKAVDASAAAAAAGSCGRVAIRACVVWAGTRSAVAQVAMSRSLPQKTDLISGRDQAPRISLNSIHFVGRL
jgi:hypothetical protein